MVAWTVEADTTTLSETFYWTEEAPLTAADRSAWTGQAAEVRAPAGFYWTLEVPPLEGGFYQWCAEMKSGTAAHQTFLGFTQGIEDLNIYPEDMDLEVEFIQEDEQEWTIEPDPDNSVP